MQQHPIPQNVMSVEFQLIGDLTLRQFGYLAVGGMVVFLLFVIPFSDILKWGLIILVGGFFASLAFIPVNDIGLDRWFVAFFRAINSPTKRIWRREIKELSYLTHDFTAHLPGFNRAPTTADRHKLDEYLESLRKEAPSDLDLAEQAYLSTLPFEEGGPAPVLANLLAPAATVVAAPVLNKPIAPKYQAKPHVEEVEEKEEKRTIEEDLTKAAPLRSSVKPVITVHMPGKNIYVKKVSTTTVNRQLHSLSSLEGTIVLPVRGEKTFELSEELKERLQPEGVVAQFGPPPAPAPSQVLTAPLPTTQTPTTPAPAPLAPAVEKPIRKGGVPIPENVGTITGAALEEFEKKLAAEADLAREQLKKQTHAPTSPAVPNTAQTELKTTVAAEAEADKERLAPLPKIETSLPDVPKLKPTPPAPSPVQTSGKTIPPTLAVGKMAPPVANVPNVVVGLIRDASGLLLTDVILVVKDAEGEPVRALKSNKVGQFAISTPLPNGRYTIDLEKEGYHFDTIGIDLAGQIFAPIEIRAQGNGG